MVKEPSHVWIWGPYSYACISTCKWNCTSEYASRSFIGRSMLGFGGLGLENKMRDSSRANVWFAANMFISSKIPANNINKLIKRQNKCKLMNWINILVR